MPKADRSERDEVFSALTSRVFAAMLDELVMDITLQSHKEIVRSRSLCSICNTQCGSLHIPTTSTNNEGSSSGKRADTPSSVGGHDILGKGQSNGTDMNSQPLLECVSCHERMLAPNRYASHLASCMGLNSTRRGAPRNSTKPKQPSDGTRSVSPTSDAGSMTDDKVKGKSTAKGKKASDEGDFTLKRKRPSSPQITPNKKKSKNTGSPVSRVKADPDLLGPPTNSHYSPSTTSQSKIPSKLRDSSTASLRGRSSNSSRESSPEIPYATPTSSFTSQSPVRSINGVAKRGRPLAMGTGPPKRLSPARVQVHVPDYHVEIDHANETGSSTDTDSD